MKSRISGALAAPVLALALGGCADLGTDPRLDSTAPHFSEAASSSAGGALLAVAYSGAYPNGFNKVYDIDPLSGQMTERVSFPAMDGLGGGLSALDAAGSRYFIVGSFRTATPWVTEPRIVSVNLETGVGEVASQPLPTWPSSMAYDASTGSLYVVLYVGQYPNGLNTLFRVDPATGATTEVGSFPRVEGLYGGLSAVDPTAQRYYLLASVRGDDQVSRPFLATVDLRTGVSTLAAAPLAAGLNSLEIDPATSALYGVAYRGTFPNGVNKLFRLDPASGAETEVGTFPQTMLGLSGLIAAIDPAGSRYFILGSFGAPSNPENRVVSMDLSSGATTVAAQPLPTFLSSLNFLPAPPKPTIERLIAQVEALEAAGTLNRGPTNALLASLEAARKQREKGHATPAANQLSAFIDKCEALVGSGQLTSDEAQPLIEAARAIRLELLAS